MEKKPESTSAVLAQTYHSISLAAARTAALLRAPSKEFESFINSGSPSFLATPGVTPLEGGIPLGRTAEIDELASAYLFLIQNDFITGPQIAVDGGIMLG